MVRNDFSASPHPVVRLSHVQKDPFFESVSVLKSLGKPLISWVWAKTLNIIAFSPFAVFAMKIEFAFYVPALVCKGEIPYVCTFST